MTTRTSRIAQGLLAVLISVTVATAALMTACQPAWADDDATATRSANMTDEEALLCYMASSYTFLDVLDPSLYWFGPVYAVADEGWMTGKETEYYGVEDALTRANMVTVIWRIACPEEAADYASEAQATTVNETGMDDVADAKYYTAAANWAVENDIVAGKVKSDGTVYFDPNGSCTFQEFCTILARYLAGGDAVLDGLVDDDAAESTLSRFSDEDSVSAYARKAIAYCVENGAVDGNSDGTLAPTTTIIRGRCATVLYKALVAGLITSADGDGYVEPQTTTVEVTASDIASKGAYKAIQAALDEAAENASGDNLYLVVVADGSYELEGTLNLYSYTYLDAEGCTFTQPSGDERNMVKVGDQDDAQQGYYYQSITVYGGTWDENGNSNTLVKAGHAAKVTLSHASFGNCADSHLMETAGVDGLIVSYCTFHDQTLSTDADTFTYEALQLDILTSDHINGYVFEDLPLRNVAVTHCTFTDVPRGVGSHTAILNNPIDGLVISKNTFTDTSSAAIQLMGVKDCTISGNTLTDTARGISVYSYLTSAAGVYTAAAISAEGGVESSTSSSYTTPTDADIVIQSNSITLSDAGDAYATYSVSGIFVSGLNLSSSVTSSTQGTIPAGNYYLTGVTIKNNTIATTGYGVRIVDARNVTCSGNKVTSTNGAESMYGISAAEGSASVSIKNNTVKNFYRGVFLNGSSSATSITSNTITDAATYGIMVENATATNITSNTITGSGSYGIFAHTGSTVASISSNAISSCTGRAIVVQALNCNLSIAGNTISNCGSDYLVVLNPATTSYTITFQNNTLSGNSAKSVAGLRISSGSVTVKSNTISSCSWPVVVKSGSTTSFSGNTYSSNTTNSVKTV